MKYSTLNKQTGFSILEIVIALSILGILALTINSGVGVTRDYDKYQENKLRMEQIRTALLTFVQVNGYLPCPDTNGTPNGIENRATVGTDNACNRWRGQLPYQMLGVPQNDVWGSPYYYAVNNRADKNGVVDIGNSGRPASFFNNQLVTIGTWDVPIFTTDTGLTPFSIAGNLTVCGETASVCVNNNTTTPASQKIERNTAVAVVVSYGKNGKETWAGETLGNAETENFDNDAMFWQFLGSNNDETGQFFDDQLIWLTGNDVKSAMLKTERGLR